MVSRAVVVATLCHLIPCDRHALQIVSRNRTVGIPRPTSTLDNTVSRLGSGINVHSVPPWFRSYAHGAAGLSLFDASDERYAVHRAKR